jgi:uncharacterized membrane protein
LIIGLATIAVCGYMAARLHRGAETVMGLLILVAVTIFLAAKVGEAPLWYGLAFLVAGPFAPLAGGALFVRSKR